VGYLFIVFISVLVNETLAAVSGLPDFRVLVSPNSSLPLLGVTPIGDDHLCVRLPKNIALRYSNSSGFIGNICNLSLDPATSSINIEPISSSNPSRYSRVFIFVSKEDFLRNAIFNTRKQSECASEYSVSPSYLEARFLTPEEIAHKQYLTNPLISLPPPPEGFSPTFSQVGQTAFFDQELASISVGEEEMAEGSLRYLFSSSHFNPSEIDGPLSTEERVRLWLFEDSIVYYTSPNSLNTLLNRTDINGNINLAHSSPRFRTSVISEDYPRSIVVYDARMFD